ncbi:MAG: type II toxin-antitoxin system VapC family toxin [Burkholderiales bacterium]|jgi:predicted nucleic acid-binding protein
MIELVVDASVAVKWFVRGQWATSEGNVDAAHDLLRSCRSGRVRFVQPAHFLAEVASVLIRLTPDTAQDDVRLLSEAGMEWCSPGESMADAMRLAHQTQHHLFDTAYHALAFQRKGAFLITADRRYFQKAASLGRLLWLEDWRRVFE